MTEYDFTYKIILFGDVSEAKSYFARSFCQHLFMSDTGITIGVDFFVRMIQIFGINVKFQIWDISAEERFKFLIPTYCRGANVGIIIYDVNNANSLAHILENIQIIKEGAGDIPIMIIGIKCVEDNQKVASIQEMQSNYLEIVQNAESIFENLAKNLIEGINADIIVIKEPIEIKRKLYRNNRPEFRVNDYLVLRLENNRTNIYVGGKSFTQCKYLLLNIASDRFEQYDELESIDEASEKLDDSMHGMNSKKCYISPETEFWGHCSNLQAWYENGYDTRLLHRNLSFSLLEALMKAGDPLAKKVFKEEIAVRIESGYPSVVMYLIKQNYLKYLTKEELQTVFENPKIQKNLSKWFEDSKLIPRWLSLKIKSELKFQNLWKQGI
ncbi:MAG: Rab family GTPase [Candidatus Odinarchaeota archaeon]